MPELEANVRPVERVGKGGARKSRKAGKLPAVVYGHATAPIPITVDPAALHAIFKESGDKNTIVNLKLPTGTLDVLVTDVQKHPVSREVLHVDFLHVTPERSIEVMVPVRTVGRPAGAVLGGRVRLVRRELRARCSYSRIPAVFEVDVTPMEIGDVVSSSQIPMPEGVELVESGDFNVVSVYGKRLEPTGVEAGEGEGAPAAAEAEASEEEAE